MSGMSERDRMLLTRFAMSGEQVERAAERAESETTDDEPAGRVYYGLHLGHDDERMADISRSEYMRRQLTRTP